MKLTKSDWEESLFQIQSLEAIQNVADSMRRDSRGVYVESSAVNVMWPFCVVPQACFVPLSPRLAGHQFPVQHVGRAASNQSCQLVPPPSSACLPSSVALSRPSTSFTTRYGSAMGRHGAAHCWKRKGPSTAYILKVSDFA